MIKVKKCIKNMVLILMERSNAASFLKIKKNNIMKIHFYIKEAIRIEK